MNLKKVLEKTEARIITGEGETGRECRGFYVSDLLSDVMGHAGEGEVWLTIQTHSNVVAVALLLNLAAALFTAGAGPDSTTIEKARAEGVVLLGTSLPTFEAAGRLYRALTEEE
ncbi:MAG: serine kinase [Firmicutes bacterium]|nr:serine kinase [Bacillota bacterium]